MCVLKEVLGTCHIWYDSSFNFYWNSYIGMQLSVCAVVNPDQTFEMRIDNGLINKGSLLEDFKWVEHFVYSKKDQTQNEMTFL